MLLYLFYRTELKHIGAEWFAEDHTRCMAEEGLEIAFQITRLELLPDVLHTPFLTWPSLSPLSTATCPPPQIPLRHVLHVISFWAWDRLNHSHSLGLHRKLDVRKRNMPVADTPACKRLSFLEGPWKVDQKGKPLTSRNGFQKECHGDVFPLFWDSSQS